jgi:hypothetical protein
MVDFVEAWREEHTLEYSVVVHPLAVALRQLLQMKAGDGHADKPSTAGTPEPEAEPKVQPEAQPDAERQAAAASETLAALHALPLDAHRLPGCPALLSALTLAGRTLPPAWQPLAAKKQSFRRQEVSSPAPLCTLCCPATVGRCASGHYN